MSLKTLVVYAVWDSEAKVWVAESEDVPGLATEADSVDALIEKLRAIVPELLELNDGDLPAEIPFELLTRHLVPSRPTHC